MPRPSYCASAAESNNPNKRPAQPNHGDLAGVDQAIELAKTIAAAVAKP